MAPKKTMFDIDNRELLALNNHHWQSSINGHFYPLSAAGPDKQARCQLRKILVSHLESMGHLKENSRQLLQPGPPPRLQDIAISISHCRTFAGFIFEPSPHTTLGLDIEQKARITPKLTAYISHQKELALAPGPAFLWGAKEAAFKAIHSHHQPSLGHICIEEWHPLSHRPIDYSFRFSFKNLQGRGHASEREGLIFAITRTIVRQNSVGA